MKLLCAAWRGVVGTTLLAALIIGYSGNAAAKQPSPPSGSLTVTIDEPSARTRVPAGTPVHVTGTVTDADRFDHVIYVVDISGSTRDSGGACGDANGDGSPDEIIDCELAGLIALTTSLGDAPVRLGVVAFDDEATALDLQPALAGVQTSTGPTTDADANGTPDVVDALRSLVPMGGTSFDAALDAVAPMTVPGEETVVVFLSDGQSTLSTGPGSPLQAVADAGATILTFSVGTGAVPCGAGSELQAMADTTGGTCTSVSDPSQLDAALVLPGDAVQVEVEVNGSVVEASVDPSGTYSATLAPELLKSGRNNITVRASNVDGEVAAAVTHVIVQGRAKAG